MIEQTPKPKNNSKNEDTLGLLRELFYNCHLTQRELAKKIGFSLGKTNYLIKELSQKGLIKIKNFSTKDHKLEKIIYILTPQGIKEKTELTLLFLKRKQEEYEDLKREWEVYYKGGKQNGQTESK